MMATHFLSLPDIVLLEIFGYLSCEDVLYAFANLHNLHLTELLTEHGAFRQICLSSQLSLRQYDVLSAGIWRYDFVRSFVCKEMFSDFLIHFTPSKIFPSLTDLRVLFLRCLTTDLTEFVIAHSSTLTHLSVKNSDQSFILADYQNFFLTVSPHLNRLKFLDTHWRSYVSIQWSRLTNCLQSLEHLFTYVKRISDVYALAIDGVFPRLQSLRICVEDSVVTVSSELPPTATLHMPNLETFDLYLTQRGQAEEGEEQVTWTTVETLTSHSVMPRLRQFSLVYTLQTSAEVGHIFQSAFFNNDQRHVRVRFGLYLITTTAIDSSDTHNISNIRSTRYKNTVVQYNNGNESELRYTWFTSSWSRWMRFWMDHNHVAPRNGVRDLVSRTPSILLHSIGKLFSDANELNFERPASLSMVDSSLTPTPLINLRRLTIHTVVPGLELLLDGIMLPRLQFLRGLAVPLFIAFVRRANQMKTLDTVDHLVITDQLGDDEKCFSFKQWRVVLDVLPRLRTLLIQFHNAKCPPMGLAELFIDYIKRTIRSPLTLFSCYIDRCSDAASKEHFITYLEERIRMDFSDVQMASMGATRLDMWM